MVLGLASERLYYSKPRLMFFQRIVNDDQVAKLLSYYISKCSLLLNERVTLPSHFLLHVGCTLEQFSSKLANVSERLIFAVSHLIGWLCEI